MSDLMPPGTEFAAFKAPWPEDLQELDRTWPLGRQLLIPDGATVLVAGAYQGKLMDYMLRGYPQIGKIVGLEPQLPMWSQAMDRMWLWHGEQHSDAKRPHWTVKPYGILATDEPTSELRDLYAFGTDAASLINMPGNAAHETQRGQGMFRDWAYMLQDCDLTHIDLFICNMEGYEYTLLPWLLEHGAGESAGTLQGPVTETDMIDSICVQFHEYAVEQIGGEIPVLDLMDEAYARVQDQYPAWVYWTDVDLADEARKLRQP